MDQVDTDTGAPEPELAEAPLMDIALGAPGRPSWRGRLHQIAFVCAVPLLVFLAIRADGARTRGGAIVYAVGLSSMFAVSAIYHRWVHTVSARAAWRRADHATIFAAIAGTTTAVALASIGSAWVIALLIVIWAAAVAGAFIKIFGIQRADRASVVLYVALGWAGAVMVPATLGSQGLLAVLLLLGGGVLYTLGAIGFRYKWPTLHPTRFSYHEVWHAYTIAAAGLHFAAIWVAVA